MNHTQIFNLSPLSCSCLVALEMLQTQVSDLGPLSDLSKIRFIDLALTPVTNLSPLSFLGRLEFVDCSFTNISGLTPLSSCSELKVLNISESGVKSLAPLLQCKELEYLRHSDLKDRNADQTEGYIDFIKERMPDLKCSGSAVGDHEFLVSIPTKVGCLSGWNMY